LVDIPERGPLDLRTIWRLVREIKLFRPHLLHAHDYKTNVLSVLLGRWFRIPVMTTMHGYVTRGGRLESYYLIDRWALRRMQHVVAVSEDLYRHAAELRVPRSRLSLIENAIDVAQYRRSRPVGAAKQRIGLSANRATVGAVGRLSPEKSFDLLIRSVDQLLSRGSDVELLIVGEGPERARLEQLIARLGRGDRIRLLGYRSDLPDWFEAMDVFALSSLREGLPNVVLEAMALETPVVATRVAGVPRLVRDGENGLLVEPNAPDQLADALARLLADPALRARLARAGRRTVEDGYSFAARMDKVRALYDGLLGRGAARR
jgi:glycosyltransferase involved in cell wall biosynthesis